MREELETLSVQLETLELYLQWLHDNVSTLESLVTEQHKKNIEIMYKSITQE